MDGSSINVTETERALIQENRAEDKTGNLARLTVYLKDPVIEKVTEEPLTSFWDLLSQTGGVMGRKRRIFVDKFQDYTRECRW